MPAKATILVVDGEPHVVRLVQANLQASGYRVAKATILVGIFALLFATFLVNACSNAAQSVGGQLDPSQPTAVRATDTPAVAATASTDAAQLLAVRCTKCHTLDRVHAAHKTQAEWEATVRRMRGKGAELNDAEADALIRYLAEKQGT